MCHPNLRFARPWLLALAATLFCCTPDTCDQIPSEPFVGVWYAGLTLDAAQQTIKAERLTPGPAIEGGPEEVLAILDYRHLETFGVLRLYFFQKKLTRARFYPDNADVYGSRFDEWILEQRKQYQDLEAEKLRDAQSGLRYIEWRSRCRMEAYTRWVAGQATKK